MKEETYREANGIRQEIYRMSSNLEAIEKYGVFCQVRNLERIIPGDEVVEALKALKAYYIVQIAELEKQFEAL